MDTALDGLQSTDHASGPRVRPMDQPPRRYRASTDRPAFLDLGKRRLDVRRLSRSITNKEGQSLFGAIVDSGWTVEDLDQHVLVVLVLKQKQPGCRYDPELAGVAKYLHVAIRGVLLNVIEGEAAQKRALEQVGVRQGDDVVDASTMATAGEDEGDEVDAILRVVLLVEDELGAHAGREARALLTGRATRDETPHDVVELVRELLMEAR